MTNPSSTRRRRGYEAERGVADYLGIERLAGSGRRDLDGGWLCVEVKERAKAVAWLLGVIAQAARLAKPEQLPIGVIHFLGQRHGDDVVLMRLSDFRDWFASKGKEKAA